MRLRDRWFLLKRRVKIAIRFRREFAWSWLTCWQMSRTHQRHMLLILAELQADEQERAEFEASVLEGIDHIDQLVLNGAI